MTARSKNFGRGIAPLLLAATTLAVGGCCTTARRPTAATKTLRTSVAPAEGQKTFASDQEAANALIAAVKAEDHDQIHALLGPEWKDLVSGDKVQDANAFKEFAQRANEKTRLEKRNDSTSIVHVGNDDWPFPIPIARTATGLWYFDTDAGKVEILERRVGDNELDAIDVCHDFVNAQRAYASVDHDGSGVMQYAQRFLSTPGKKDGLYWQAAAGEPQSPLAKLVDEAEKEGYEVQHGRTKGPYHGYRFRILKRQGPAAPGGAYSYIIHGKMVAGFALVAYPADYGSSGVMTFIVNDNGTVYQKDLGDHTDEIAGRMQAYDPDSTWSAVK